MIGRVYVFLGLSLFVVAFGAAASAEGLQPTSMWNLDYGYTQCTALRTYGNPQNPVTLGLAQSPEGDTYELFVGRADSHSKLPEESQGSVDFGSGPTKSWLLEYSNT